MEERTSDEAAEIQRLRSLNRDLIALLALPAMWQATAPRGPGAIVEVVLDVLLSTLRLDFVFATIREPPLEMARADGRLDYAACAAEIGRALARCGTSPLPAAIPSPIGEGETRLTSLPLPGGLLVAASQRSEFPSDRDLLLLRVAVNQALMGFDVARLMERQRKLAAASLDIHPGSSLDALLRGITEKAREIIGAHRSVTSMTLGEDGSQAIEAVSRSDEYAARRGDDEARGGSPTRGRLAVPIVGRDGRDIGLIQLTDKVQGEFDEEDQQILIQLAQMASVAIENTRLYRRLSEQNQLIQTIANNATLPVFMLDARQHCTFMNPAAERMTGFALAHVQGRPLHDVVHHTRPDGSAYPISECPINQALPRRSRMAGEELFVRRDGSFYPVAFTASPIVEGGVPVGTVIEVRDITEEKRAQQALRKGQDALVEADRRKDEFLAMLGHELRNPLAPIVTALELMKLRGDRSAEPERAVIERQVEHVSRLVDDLLDISRITRGKIQLKRERIEVSRVLAKAIEMASPLLEQREHHLELDAPPSGLVVDADPVRLAQVLANLLTNAAKYTERRGHIRVWARRDGGEIAIRVNDDGIGIAPEMLPNLFEPFVQGPRTLDRAEGGLGLGLPLVRSLVGLHGGSVTAHSDGPGAGSEFTVRLPARDAGAEVAEARPPAAPADLEDVARKRILVVDDNEDAALTLADALRLLGHEVVVAHDGPQALKLAETFDVEIALLDIGLPVMDGYELARRLRQLKPADLRLFALTGYGQELARARSREAGFDEHFIKPLALGALLDAMRAPAAAHAE